MHRPVNRCFRRYRPFFSTAPTVIDSKTAIRLTKMLGGSVASQLSKRSQLTCCPSRQSFASHAQSTCSSAAPNSSTRCEYPWQLAAYVGSAAARVGTSQHQRQRTQRQPVRKAVPHHGARLAPRPFQPVKFTDTSRFFSLRINQWPVRLQRMGNQVHQPRRDRSLDQHTRSAPAPDVGRCASRPSSLDRQSAMHAAGSRC